MSLPSAFHKHELILKHLNEVKLHCIGCVEVMIMHPLDLIKTRFQLQNTVAGAGSEQHYTGVRDCMVKMYRQEGLRSFWKGLLPPVLVETPKRAWKVLSSLRKHKLGDINRVSYTI